MLGRVLPGSIRYELLSLLGMVRDMYWSHKHRLHYMCSVCEYYHWWIMSVYGWVLVEWYSLLALPHAM
jgi:hypothetical protein